MDKNTLSNFHQGVNSIYEQLYTNNITIRLLDESKTEKNEIYNEAIKVYQEPISLLSKIKLDNKVEELSYIGQQNMAEGYVEVPYLEMKKHELDKIPLNVLRRGIIEFMNTTYDIVNIPIDTTFNNEISKYRFEIKVKIDG